MRELTADEVAYIYCALEFQLDHDDGSNPPPIEAGHSAMEKLQGITQDGRRVMVFSWNTEKGECYECGAPAAYRAPYMYGDDRKDTPHVGPESLLCCVCAAQHAANGEQIVWLYEEKYA